jgi:hypothetical protein
VVLPLYHVTLLTYPLVPSRATLTTSHRFDWVLTGKFVIGMVPLDAKNSPEA